MSKTIGSLAVGSLVKDTGSTYYGKPVINVIIGQNHDGSNSTTLQTQKIITLKAFDAIESSNSDSNRKSYGNNRYLYSNILQWLNSDAAAGAWYTAQHSADAAPTNANVWSNYNEYDKQAGFLNGFSADMKNALMSVSKRTAKNTVTDGGGYEDVTSKVFLLSNTEVGLANENNIAEGTKYDYYSTSSNRIAYPTAEAVSNSEYTDSSLSASSAWYWWLRSPYAGHSYYARSVNTDGSLSNYYAFSGNLGVRPAYVIPSTLKVSDEPDTDGAYVIEWNAAPTITTDSTELGEKNAPFSFSYTIKDPDGDTATGKLYFDDSVIEDLGAIDQTKTYTHSVKGTELSKMENATHRFKIYAVDSNGNEASTTINFTKTASPVTVSGDDKDLGNVWLVPEYKYTVTTDVSTETLASIVETIDGVETRSVSSPAFGTEYSFDFSTFESLSDETAHTAVITVTGSSGALSIRTITFTKLYGHLSFYTDAVTTDEAAKKIVAKLNYDTTGDPDIKVEATNNANATSPVWEDITDSVKNNEYYTFKNDPTADYGVSVKVTVTKNTSTERVYVTGLGFSFS